MKLNPFKNDKAKEVKKKKDEKPADLKVEKSEDAGKPIQMTSDAGAYRVLKSFYVSEKASLLLAMNQYVFRVLPSATKSEVAKKVEKLFNVKVKNVKIINLPSKVRNVGRHSGTKSGFKKAIVILKEGYTIEQAKA